MAEVKWIKLTTDMFNNRKIKHLRRLPDGNSIVLIWVMLLTMAGRCNSNGLIFLTENIPYTPKMLADELDFEENTVKLALEALEQLNMIVTDGNFFTIAGWEEYQNIEGMDKIREQNRIRQAKYKQKKKLLAGNVTNNVIVTQGNATDKEEDKEKDIEIESEKRKKREKPTRHHHGEFGKVLLSDPEYKKLVDDFGCELTDKAIKFLDEYIEEKGYKSKSHNLAIRRWVIDAVKERETSSAKQNVKPKQFNFEPRAAFERAVARSYAEKPEPKTAADDDSIRERAEALRKQFNQTGGNSR